MKNSAFSLLVFFLVFGFSHAQVPDFAWVKCAPGNGYNISPHDLVSDAAGNTYATGSFSTPTISFGNITLNNAAPTTADVFVVKRDAAGNVLWAKYFGGTGTEVGYSLALDGQGNLCLLGRSRNADLAFGTTTLTNTEGKFIIFTVKIDPDGNVLWAKKGQGGTSTQAVDDFGLAADSQGNVVICGTYKNHAMTFDGVVFPSALWRYYVIKYDAVGNIVWSKTSAENANQGHGIAVDGQDNIYFVGSYHAQNFALDNIPLPTNEGANAFLAKYNPNGEILWAKPGIVADSGWVGLHDITVSAAGKIGVTGYFFGSQITFDNVTLNSGVPGTVYDATSLTLVFDQDGNTVWGNVPSSANDYDSGGRIVGDALGNFYVSGTYPMQHIQFGDFSLNDSAMYLVKYNPTGQIDWATKLAEDDEIVNIRQGLAIDAAQNIYLTGRCLSNTVFGSITNADPGMFIAKMDQNALKTPEFLTSGQTVLFPNPVSDVLHLRLAHVQRPDLKFFDLTGKLLNLNYTVQGNEVSVDVDALSAGVYLVELTLQNNSTQQMKFIRR